MEKVPSAKQLRFIEEYLIDMNASGAARRAGYSVKNASKAGRRLLATPAIAQRVAQRQKSALEQAGVDQQRVLGELAAIAFSQITDYLAVREGVLEVRDTAALSRWQVAAIHSIRTGAKGVDIRLHDKQAALDCLAKRLNLYAGGDDAENRRRLDSLRALLGEVAGGGGAGSLAGLEPGDEADSLGGMVGEAGADGEELFGCVGQGYGTAAGADGTGTGDVG